MSSYSPVEAVLASLHVAPGDEDYAIWAVAQVVCVDFVAARLAAQRDPLVTRFGRLVPSARASRLDSYVGVAKGAAVMFIALVMGVVGSLLGSPILSALDGAATAPPVAPHFDLPTGAEAHDLLDAGDRPASLTPATATTFTACTVYLALLSYLIVSMLACTQASFGPWRPATNIYCRWRDRGPHIFVHTAMALLPVVRALLSIRRLLWRLLAYATAVYVAVAYLC